MLTKDNKIIMTTKELAELFDISVRRIQQIIKALTLEPYKRGSYDLKTFLSSYLKYNMTYSDEDVDYAKEKALHERSKREISQIELAVKKNNLHSSEDIKEIWGKLLSNFKTKILNIPIRVAPKLIAQEELGIIQQILKDECYEVLEALASSDIDRLEL